MQHRPCATSLPSNTPFDCFSIVFSHLMSNAMCAKGNKAFFNPEVAVMMGILVFYWFNALQGQDMSQLYFLIMKFSFKKGKRSSVAA